MIRLSRDGTEIPRVFGAAALALERKRAEAFYSQTKSARSQRRFEWERTVRLLNMARDPLGRISRGKCAYCEQRISGRPNLEHFRPKRGAIGLDGRLSVDHYWWLAFEWTNLLPACTECNVTKASRFPVRHQRAALGATGAALLEEEPLLLDPFRDQPDEHLVFTETGLVAGRTERGGTTIEVLALNRQSLVAARAKHILDLRDAVAKLAAASRENPVEAVTVAALALRTFLSLDSPHLGVTRQFLHSLAKEFAFTELLPSIVSVIGGTKAELASLISDTALSKDEIKVTQNRFEERARRKERHSVETESKAANTAYFGGARRIEHIVIHNFRAVRHLEIDLPAPGSERESWLMLVGENAVGKSSLLQAIALTLMGQEQVTRMALDARQCVCRDGQEDEGWVRIHLTNLSQPIELRFNRHDRHFHVTPPESLVLLLGYGATRLLPRAVTRNERALRYVRVRNLFNPYARLSPTERWLTDRKTMSKPRFDRHAWALKQLLMLEERDTVTRERRRVVVKTDGFSSSLMDLSDGYQSVVALAGDIMASVGEKWDSIESAEGVVLIDEIETHLHPFWKMQIVGRLRRVFPKLTFIVTTHDPLCLRGLLPGEILVMRRRGSEILAEPVRESIDHLRADQLLTSPLFGLAHTRAESVEREIERCAELLGKRARTAAEEDELLELQTRLSVSLQAGETPSQRTLEKAMEETLDQLPPDQLWGPLPVVASRTLPAELNVALKQRLASLQTSLGHGA